MEALRRFVDVIMATELGPEPDPDPDLGPDGSRKLAARAGMLAQSALMAAERGDWGVARGLAGDAAALDHRWAEMPHLVYQAQAAAFGPIGGWDGITQPKPEW